MAQILRGMRKDRVGAVAVVTSLPPRRRTRPTQAPIRLAAEQAVVVPASRRAELAAMGQTAGQRVSRFNKMRKLLFVFVLALVLALALPVFGQSPPLSVISPDDLVSNASGILNYNFGWLYNNKASKFSGSGAPGIIGYAALGDLYFDTTNIKTYACFSVSCAVSTPNWTLITSGGGGGGGGLFTSYQFGTQTALTGTGIYLQTTYPSIFSLSQTGGGTPGNPFVD